MGNTAMATTLFIQTATTSLTVSLPATAPMTRDEFQAFCQANRNLRIEQTATGGVVIMPPVFADTGNRNFNLAVQLGIWAKQDATGLGFDSSTGFTLPNGATRSPDAAWMKTEKWNALAANDQASFAPICPDFVIELRSAASDPLSGLKATRSASDSLSELKAKMQEYIDNGVLLGWLIDRKNRTVYIYRPDRAPQLLENCDRVNGDPELPGFRLSMAEIW